MIEIKDLSYTQDKIEILKNINITINEGEVIGIIGKSGSGKTTLLKIIAGLLKGYTGDILIDTVPLQSYTTKDLGKNISYLFNNRSDDIIDDIVSNFLLLSRKSFKKLLNPFSEYDIQIAEEYSNLFNLNRYKKQKILSLPDGIFKKALLAYTFIKRADTLILDNPTSDLDIHSILSLQNALFRYVMDGDKISIIASNELNFISQTVDRFLLLEDGELKVEGVPDIIDAKMIEKYFDIEVLISRNIYNGKPEIHIFPGN